MPTLKSLQDEVDELKKQNLLMMEALGKLTDQDESSPMATKNYYQAEVKLEPGVAFKAPSPKSSPVTNQTTTTGQSASLSVWIPIIFGLSFIMLFNEDLVWIAVLGILVSAVAYFRHMTASSSTNVKTNATATESSNGKKIKLQKNDDIEEKIGIKWFAGIGILALVIGVGFFIKYAIDNNLINHLTRIILGVGIGIITAIIGQIAIGYDKYKHWGATLVGGGLAIIYFVIYAAYHFTNYREAIGISQGLDIILLIIVGAITIISSLKNNSQLISAEAFILGFVTALLGQNLSVLTLVYVAILAIVLITVSAYKQWYSLNLIGIVGAYLSFFLWFNYHPASAAIGLAFLGIYFLTYTVVSFLIKQQDEISQQYQIGLTLINSAGFFGLAFWLIRLNYLSLDGLFCFALTIFYGLVYYCAQALKQNKLALTNFYLALLFFTLAIPLQFNPELVTIFWALETLLLTALWTRTGSQALKYSALTAWAVTFIKAFAYDLTSLAPLDTVNIINSTRLISLLATALCFYLAYYLISRKEDLIADNEDIILNIFSLSATALMIIVLLVDFKDYIAGISYALCLLLLAVTFIAGRAKNLENLKYSSYLIALTLALKVFIVDLWQLEPFVATNLLASSRLLTGLTVVFTGYFLAIITAFLKPKQWPLAGHFYSWSATSLLALIVLIESFGPTCWTTIWWSLISLGLLLFGYISDKSSLKLQASALTIITALKLFVYDSTLTEFHFNSLATSHRFIAYAFGIILLYFSAIFLSQIKTKTDFEITLTRAYSWLGSSALSLLIVLEIQDYWISIGWAIFSALLLLIGFSVRNRDLRYQGLILIGLTILKVFLYDTRELDTLYRTGSFMVLGVILLSLSFIYNKYKDKLKEVL